MIRRILVTLLLSSLAGLTLAAGTSHIEADKMVYKEREGVTVFSGHVHYREPQQGLSILADQVTIFSKQHNVVRIEASGNPVRFTHKGRKKPITGEARELEYIAARDTVTLNGAARVQSGKDLIRGEQIKYDIATRQAVASNTGGHAGGRFEAILTPGQHNSGDGQSK